MSNERGLLIEDSQTRDNIQLSANRPNVLIVDSDVRLSSVRVRN